MSLTYAIADLHGRFDLLEAAFEAIAENIKSQLSDEFKIITLGDYVDCGPQSRQVIAHLMAFQAAGGPLICLKGNHEDMMVETIIKPRDPGWWVENGGAQTLVSYGGIVQPEHIEWAKNLPMIHFDQYRVFVHAGVNPGAPLDEQVDKYMMWFRYPEYADVGHGDRHVIHGHTPNPNGPERYENRTNLDTLAWRTGRLVIAVFDDDIAGGPINFINVGPGARGITLPGNDHEGSQS